MNKTALWIRVSVDDRTVETANIASIDFNSNFVNQISKLKQPFFLHENLNRVIHSKPSIIILFYIFSQGGQPVPWFLSFQFDRPSYCHYLCKIFKFFHKDWFYFWYSPVCFYPVMIVDR